jgi:hypothetical protein
LRLDGAAAIAAWARFSYDKEGGFRRYAKHGAAVPTVTIETVSLEDGLHLRLGHRAIHVVQVHSLAAARWQVDRAHFHQAVVRCVVEPQDALRALRGVDDAA